MAESDPAVLEEQAREARALVGVVGALAGLHEIPPLLPGREPAPMPSLAESVHDLTAASHLPGPVRLELLARLHTASKTRSLGNVDLRPLAGSLGREGDLSSDAVQHAVLDRLDKWVEGTEPLGRATLGDLADNQNVAWSLRDDIACTALTVRPGCGAMDTVVQGHRSLSIVTDMTTCKEFGDFDTIVDPTQWPDCWLQGQFFKSMVPQGTKRASPIPDVPAGWRQTIEETCDFGLALFGDDSGQLRTLLDFVYFWNPPSPGADGGAGSPARVGLATPVPGPGVALAPASPVVTPSTTGCAGCTYDFVASVDQQLLVDQGYLLVEQIPGSNYRRYRTQKEVCFSAGNLPPGAVCGFWSLALALIVLGCI
jgi:hypothetical protein